MAAQNGMDRAEKRARAFAVNDAELENASIAAGCDVIEKEFLDLARLKSVQIEHAIDWNFHGLVFRIHGE